MVQYQGYWAKHIEKKSGQKINTGREGVPLSSQHFVEAVVSRKQSININIGQCLHSIHSVHGPESHKVAQNERLSASIASNDCKTSKEERSVRRYSVLSAISHHLSSASSLQDVKDSGLAS